MINYDYLPEELSKLEFTKAKPYSKKFDYIIGLFDRPTTWLKTFPPEDFKTKGEFKDGTSVGRASALIRKGKDKVNVYGKF